MSSIILTGDTSGTLTVSAPLVAGSNTLTLAAATGTLSPLVSATAQASTSGTSIDFTGIPSYAKRITVMFSGVSTNGTSIPIIQLGDSGGIENTGYTQISAQGTAAFNSGSTGFAAQTTFSAALVLNGVYTFVLLDAATFQWSGSGTFNENATPRSITCSGVKTLSAILDRVRITTVNGTDTFDAGTINILYE